MQLKRLLLALASASFLLSACGSEDGGVVIPDGNGTEQRDRDGDSIPDAADNCPTVVNQDQADSDNDGVGNACEAVVPPPADGDGDTVPDATDNCPAIPNTDQADSDADGIGNACEPVTPPPVEDFVSCTGTTCTLLGTVNKNFTLSAAFQWRLSGVVKVGNGNIGVTNDADVATLRAQGVTLTIEPGVHVRATTDGVLIVTRGSKLNAEGRADAPITFSSAADDNLTGEGEWGGVIIQGFAPQYGKGNSGGACFGTGTVCNVVGEGGDFVGVYGGNDKADNSGVIKYVRITEGGLVAGPNNEINGLTLMGVGYGTVIDYVQVHSNLDDGIEWFGGTVNVTHAVLTNNDDDDIDFDEGYQGNIQYAIVQKNLTKAAPSGSNDPRAIEANSSNADRVPQTSAVLSNLTLIGGSVVNATGKTQPGALFRGAVTATMVNTAITGFNVGCTRIDDAVVNSVTTPSVINFTNVLANCANGIYANARAADTATNVVATPVTFNSGYAVNESTAVLASAPAITPANNGSSFTFEPTTYVGAVAPGTPANTAWWAKWTIPGSLAGGEEQPASAPFVSCASGVCTVTGTINTNYTFTAGVEWRLNGVVKVGNGNVGVTSDADVTALRTAGVSLTIRPGVNVRGTANAVLLVTRGSKLIADGRSDAPITFSSASDDNLDGEGEWGGVIIQGFAPQFSKGNAGSACFGTGTICNVVGEGGDFVGVYGGNDKADSSGIIRYLRITEGGLVAGPNNEVNGLTLMGVGYGTVIDYVQVHNNLDDGIEWFGGTVNVTHAVLTNNDDDDIDYDEGYQGNIQFAIVQKNRTKAGPSGSNDPRAIEANSSNADRVTQTNAVMANLTLLGGTVVNAAGKIQPGALFRGAVTSTMVNTAIKGFDAGCTRIDDSVVNNVTTPSVINFTNVYADCAAGIYASARTADTAANVIATPVTLDAARALTDANATLAAAPAITPAATGSGFVFTQTNYVGAVAPGTPATSAWWANWTIPGSL